MWVEMLSQHDIEETGKRLATALRHHRERHPWTNGEGLPRIGLPTEKLEEMTGIPASTIRRWENTGTVPPAAWHRAAECLSVLGVTVELPLTIGRTNYQ
jgi:hypothetical protein